MTTTTIITIRYNQKLLWFGHLAGKDAGAEHSAVCFRMTPFRCFVSCCVIAREVAETAWLSSGFRFFRRDHPATQL